MKHFNQIITVEVPVNAIANMLLDSMNPEFKHKELVVEAIVGRMLNDNSLTFLYNSLNGYPCEIDFQVGDTVRSNTGLQVYAYWTPESIEKNNTCYGIVTEATIVEVDPYRDDKLRIEYNLPNKKGGFDKADKWVKHTNWNRVVPEKAEL